MPLARQNSFTTSALTFRAIYFDYLSFVNNIQGTSPCSEVVGEIVFLKTSNGGNCHVVVEIQGKKQIFLNFMMIFFHLSKHHEAKTWMPNAQRMLKKLIYNWSGVMFEQNFPLEAVAFFRMDLFLERCCPMQVFSWFPLKDHSKLLTKCMRPSVFLFGHIGQSVFSKPIVYFDVTRQITQEVKQFLT